MEQMRTLEDTALVLEGGGMRGVFTSGVLDSLMKRGIRFPYVIGVSAGACNGLSYMSCQPGRARFSNIEMLERYRYIGLRHWWRQHNIMDFELLFHDFPERILPFDYEAYFRNPGRFVMVTTNCQTGRAEYLEERHDRRRLVDIARASSSLPFVCPIARVDGVPMLDGGIVDSIPVARALAEGYTRCVVVLTRNRGYRKTLRGTRVPRFIYHKYPLLQQAINRRSRVYNEQLALVERLEDEGRITVIRPLRPVQVGRIERDIDKLKALYEEGVECGAQLALDKFST